VNIAVHFIRARSSLISCSSEGFPIYIRYLVGRERRRKAGYKDKRERGEESLEL